jgi:predicted DNA-binding protein (MmcQ/YjbR family)
MRSEQIFARPVFARVRRKCLALPESVETSSWGHPNFRAGRKTFCTFELVKGRPSVAFRLAPADVERLIDGKRFFLTPYGRGQWASAWLDEAVDRKLIDQLIDASYRTVATTRMLSALTADG